MNLEQRKVVKEADLRTVLAAKRLIGHNRFSALHKCFNPDEQQLTMFLTMLRNIILKEITLGTVLAIDDHIVAYFGQHMCDAGLAVKMKEKPHGYG